jgi:hypothetical protein
VAFFLVVVDAAQDDAEAYAAEILAADPDRDVPDGDLPSLRNLGGAYAIPGGDAPRG